MSVSKSFYKSIINIFSKQFYFWAGLASIIGLIIIFIKKDWAVITALSFFCLMLVIFTSYLIYSLYRILDTNESDHDDKSTFIKYETSDGKKIMYETYKLIQSKKPVLAEFDYNFHWTGTIMPQITSDLQDVKNVVDEKDPSVYDRAVLKLKKPLYYNKSCVIHFRAHLDDSDEKSGTHVETRVISDVDIIHYRIILKHREEGYSKNANIERKKINSTTSRGFEKIQEIAFDTITKSYEHHLLNPEIGYYYRISWER